MRRALLLMVLVIGCGGKVEATEVNQGTGGSSGHASAGAGGSAGMSAAGGAGIGGSSGGGAGQGGSSSDPCSLELVQPDAADNLTSSVGNPMPQVSAPVAVATPSGFLAIYLESGENSPSIVVLQPVTDQGALAASPSVLDFKSCPSDPSASLTAAWNDLANKGLLAVAWPACGSDPASILFAEFDATGNIGSTMVPPVLPYEVVLQPQSGTIAAPNDTSFILATLTYSVGYVPTFYEVNDLTVAIASSSFPTLSDTSLGVALAGTGQIVSFLTAGTKEAGWYVAPPNAPFTVASLPAAKVGRVAASGDRAMAVVITTEGMPWWVRNANGIELQKGLIADPLYPASLLAAEDHFLLASTADKTISIYRFDHVSSSMDSGPATKVTLPQKMGNTSLETFQIEPLSMAAARGRVLVTWTNYKGTPPMGTSWLGGYALLKCAAP